MPPRKRTRSSDTQSPPKAEKKQKQPEPWPQYFVQLQRVYQVKHRDPLPATDGTPADHSLWHSYPQALNTIYTFCSSRKHIHTTIQNMRSSVEGLIKAPLQIESIAQIKTLMPHLVRLVYVDKDTLAAVDQINQKKHYNNNNKSGSKNADVYEPNDEQRDAVDQVLLFQFLDGELKTTKTDSKKAAKNLLARQRYGQLEDDRCQQDNNSLPPHDLITPTYSPKAMIKMVEKRNLKFQQAVQELLDACQAEDPSLDASELLIQAALSNHPTKPQDDSSRSKLDPNPTDDPNGSSSEQIVQISIETVLNELKSSPHYRGQIVENGERVTPARQACYQELETSSLSPKIQQSLFSTNRITKLYSHQAKAIDSLSSGENVIVTTSTSSGKSLIYQIPLLQTLEKDLNSCAIYIFPTKALARDQKRSLDQLILNYGPPISDSVRIDNYDGDTSANDRIEIRKSSNVIFTNPDMIHYSILPHEEQWRRIIKNCKFIVLDELHIYSDQFGSNVAMIMRRLLRLCRALGNSSVQIISCSATIVNPTGHMKKMFGIDRVELISEDGAPSGAKRQIIWNPPLIDEHEPGQGRTNSILETSKIFIFLLERNIRTIVFCRIRRTCELLMKQIQEDLCETGRRDLQNKVRSYRAGYTVEERRLIEAEMFNGSLIGIIATTALELGIDIGGLDAVITLGFPHSLSGLIQQAGRAGRRNKESLSILVLEQRALDQHFASNPDELLQSTKGSSISLDLEDQTLLTAHLHCAAHEIPIVIDEDSKIFGNQLQELCEKYLKLDESGEFYHSDLLNPAQQISIRGISSSSSKDSAPTDYSVIDITDHGRPKIIEQIEKERVLINCFEGAIFLHQGSTFQVIELNHTLNTVQLRSALVNYFTRAILFVQLIPIHILHRSAILPDSPTHYIFLGKIKINTSITGYLKLDSKNHKKVLDRIELPYIPPENYASISMSNKEEKERRNNNNSLSQFTHGVWMDIPFQLKQDLVDLFKTRHPHQEPADQFIEDDMKDQVKQEKGEGEDKSNNYHLVNLILHLVEHLILHFFHSNSSKSTYQNKEKGKGKGRENVSIVGDQDQETILLNSIFDLSHHHHNLKVHCTNHLSSSNSDHLVKLTERILIYEDPKKYFNIQEEQVEPSDYLNQNNNTTSSLSLLSVNLSLILSQVSDFLQLCSCLNGCSKCILKPICSSNLLINYSHTMALDAPFKFAVLVVVNHFLDRVWAPDDTS